MSRLLRLLTSTLPSLATGAAVRLTGSWDPSPAAGQSHELHAQRVEILGPSNANVRARVASSPRPKVPADKSRPGLALQTFPIQKKYQTPEFLRTLPHLRSRTPFNSALLRFRSEVVASLNSFFASRDFTQVHPPLLTSSDCEGAGEVFTVSPARQNASSAGAETSDSFFRSPKYLTVSSQLHLEALAQSVGSVWTLSPTFRAERSDTARHLSEFYMLEAEVCFVDDLGGVMDLLEDMLRSLSTTIRETRAARDLLQHGSRPAAADHAPAAELQRRWDGLEKPSWPRLTYTEAIDILKSAGRLFAHPPTWGSSLQTDHEKYIADVVGGDSPVFVTHYPRDIKAFYMLPTSSSNSDSSPDANVSGKRYAGAVEDGPGRPTTVDCFDLLVPEFCEIAGGSMREHRLPQLLDSMRSHGLLPATAPPNTVGGSLEEADPTLAMRETDDLHWYVDLRRWGCPPHGGFGLGFDRLLCYLSGVQSVRDVVAFPRWHGRCDC